MAESYTFSRDGAKRIASAVRKIEGMTPSGGGAPVGIPGLQCIVAQLTEKDGDYYSWVQKKRINDEWADFTGQLTGGDGSGMERPAVALDPDGDDLTDEIVVLVRVPMLDDGSDTVVKVCWAIAGAPSGGAIEPGLYQGQVLSMLADNSVGWNFPVLHEEF